MSIRSHLLDVLTEDDGWISRKDSDPPLPVSSSHQQLQPVNASQAAAMLLSFLSARPTHAGHLAISSASCCSTAPELAECKVCLELDILDMMQVNPSLARALVTDPEGVRLALMDVLHGDGVFKLKFSRVWIRLTKVPVVPEPSISSMMGQCIAWSRRSSTGAGDSSPQLVQFTGVVSAASSPWIKIYSQTWCCIKCGAEVQRLGGQFSTGQDDEAPKCCSVDSSDGQASSLQEDLSQRIMVPAQDIWVRDLSSALGSNGSFAVGQGSLLVRLTDELPPPGCPGLKIGDIVQVLGPPRFVPAASADTKYAGYDGTGGQVVRAAGRVEVPMLHLSKVDPSRAWSAGRHRFSAGGGGAEPGSEPDLQDLCNMLVEALGHYVPLPLCLALLVSAAAVAKPTDHGPQQQQPPAGKRSYAARPLQQLSILLVEEAPSMLLQKILRPAAHLLSPHSTFLGVHMEDMITPRVQSYARADQDGQDVQVVHSSVLTSVNCGILVLDCLVLDSPKLKLQLTEALARGHIVLGSSAAAAKKSNGLSSVTVPVTATVWAVTTGVQTQAGCEGGEAWGAGARGQKGVARAMRDDGFNLVLPYTLDDEELVTQGVLEPGIGDEAGSSGRAWGEAELQHATRLLRRQLCAARCRPCHPQFTGDGLALLQRYVVSVRQSAVGGHVPHAQIVSSLVALSRGCALLLEHAAVLPHPDCVVAILLVETSLCTRFGSAYFNSCMPPRMQLRPDVLLEEQLFALYQILDMQLQEVVPTTSAPGDWPSTVSG